MSTDEVFLDYFCSQISVLPRSREDFSYFIYENGDFDDWDALSTDFNIPEIGYRLFKTRDNSALFRPVLLTLLHLKKYDDIARIVACSLVNVHYHEPQFNSTKYNYSASERYFDRFVEMMKTARIDLLNHISILLRAYSQDACPELYAWQRPVSEYLAKETVRDFEGIAALIEKSEYSFLGICALSEFNPDYSVRKITDMLLYTAGGDKKLYRDFLTSHKTKILPEMLEAAGSGDIAVRENAVRMLLALKNDSLVFESLERIFENEPSKRLKTLIAKECGFTVSGLDFSTRENFTELARNSGVSRISFKEFPRIKYSDGTPLEYRSLKFLVKYLGAGDLTVLQKHTAVAAREYLDRESLTEFCKAIGREIFLTERWLPYFAAAFFEGAEILALYKRGEKDKRFLKTLIRALAICPEKEADKILLTASGMKPYRAAARESLSIKAQLNNTGVDDLLDSMCPDILKDLVFTEGDAVYYGDIKNLEFIVVDKRGRAVDTQTLKSRTRAAAGRARRLAVKEIKNLSARLYEGFFAERRWSYRHFTEVILTNKFFSRILETLVFAEVRKESAGQIFTVRNSAPAGIFGETVELRGLEIRLLHPVDYTGYKNLLPHFPVQPFPQLNRPPFELNEQEIYQNSVTRFKNNMTDSGLFFETARKLGWKRERKTDGRECVYKVSSGILAEFLVSGTGGAMLTVGEIRFYDAMLIPKALGKYILSGTGGVYASELSKIYMSEIIFDAYRMVKQ